MKISYKRLFKLMEKKHVKKTDLRNVYGISAATVDRLVKDQNVNTSTIVRLCEILKCQPRDILSVRRH